MKKKENQKPANAVDDEEVFAYLWRMTGEDEKSIGEEKNTEAESKKKKKRKKMNKEKLPQQEGPMPFWVAEESAEDEWRLSKPKR